MGNQAATSQKRGADDARAVSECNLHLQARAKLNLSLKVGPRRDDGLHGLTSLMVPLELADELQLQPRQDGRVVLSLDGPWADATPAGEENLVARAARLLAETVGRPIGADVRITKRIPVGGGLAGGSADAAAALVGLNRLHGLGLSAGELTALAAGLGSDVPFCVTGRPAWVGGAGERVEPTAQLPRLWAVLILPGLSVSTAEVYREFDRLRAGGEQPTRRAFGLGGIELFNDLEQASLRVSPQLASIHQTLEKTTGVPRLLVAGSGSTLFAIFDNAEEAQRWEDRVGSAVECPVIRAATVEPPQ